MSKNQLVAAPLKGQGMKDHVRTTLEELASHLRILYDDRLIKAVLFGSQARGDAEGESDVDVMVVLKGEVDTCEEIDRTIDIVAELSLSNDLTISCVFVSEESYNEGMKPLLVNARREGVLL